MIANRYILKKLCIIEERDTYSMNVELKLYASLGRHVKEKTGIAPPDVVAISENTRIKQLLEHFSIPLDMVKLIFLNGIHATGDELLKDGDRIGVFPPVAGG